MRSFPKTSLAATLAAMVLILFGALWLIAPLWQPGFKTYEGALPVPGSTISSGAVTTTEPININTATAEELQTLPGIGEKRAQDIIAYRTEHGPFTNLEDLSNISGISARMAESWQGLAVVGTDQ